MREQDESRDRAHRRRFHRTIARDLRSTLELSCGCEELQVQVNGGVDIKQNNN